ncbi:MAG: hypothetical protein ABL997_01230 [Planctomycetota bacterium]
MSKNRASDLLTKQGPVLETAARTSPVHGPSPTTHHAPTTASLHERLDEPSGARAFGPGRPGNLVVAEEGAVYGTALLRREAQGLRQFGDRLLAQVESQDLFLTELRKMLQSIEEESSAETRGTLQQLARTANEVVDWCFAVQLELQNEGSRAVAGEQPIDLLELVHDVLHDLGAARPEREVLVRGSAPFAAWGSVAAMGRVVRLALELVDARTAGTGHVHVEVGQDDDGHFLAILGQGDARNEPSHDRVEEFRDAAESAGVRVLPDSTTEGRTGLLLRLPASDCGPLLPLH